MTDGGLHERVQAGTDPRLTPFKVADKSCELGDNFVLPAVRHIDTFESKADYLGQYCPCGDNN